MTHTEPERVLIRWRTKDLEAIAAIRNRFNIPNYTTVNGLSPAEITLENKDLFEECQRRGFFGIIRRKWRKNGDHYIFNSCK